MSQRRSGLPREEVIRLPLLGIEVLFLGQRACKIFVIARLEHIVPITVVWTFKSHARLTCIPDRFETVIREEENVLR